MFIRPELTDLPTFVPNFTVLHAPEFQADPARHGTRSSTFIALNLTERYFGIPFPIPSFGAICRLCHEVRHVDVVLLQDSLYPVCMAAFVFAHLSRKPVVIAQHVGLVPYNNPVFRTMMDLANTIIVRRMLARAQRVAFFSEITARYFDGIRFRSPPKLMFTGVDTDIFFPARPGQKAQLRERLGLPHSARGVLFEATPDQPATTKSLNLSRRQDLS